jgi:four helix bundle protein
MLSHEKLEVYQRSIQFLELSDRLVAALPKGHTTLISQLRRAALSVPLNIAEASGRTGSADNAQRFGIARGSALECGAILDACRVLRVATPGLLEEGRQPIVAIVSMLSKLVRVSSQQCPRPCRCPDRSTLP